MSDPATLAAPPSLDDLAQARVAQTGAMTNDAIARELGQLRIAATEAQATCEVLQGQVVATVAARDAALTRERDVRLELDATRAQVEDLTAKLAAAGG